ncbi:MAG: DUF5678 domain-containing protein [bacterium]|nr:DUF5678 domain-containing protein [bacterium]
MEKEKVYARMMKKYERKWVALVGSKVVAVGTTLAEVKEVVERKRMKNYVFHLVPPSSVSLAPSFIL